MKKVIVTMLAAGLFQTAFAHSVHAIDVDDAWARTTVNGMNMGGVFMEIENETAKADYLVGGSSPVAERVEVHTHINEDGVMKMREIKGGLALPVNQEVKLKPGAAHVMLMGLKKPLQAGEHFPLTLKFKYAKPVTVDVEVKSPTQEQAKGHHHSHDHQHSHDKHEHHAH